MADYEVVWSPASKQPIPDNRVSGWVQRGSYLTDAGESNYAATGLPSGRKLRGKGVSFDHGSLRAYNRAPGDRSRLCLCGRGISDHDFAQGEHQCWMCRGQETRKAHRKAKTS